MRSPRPLLRRAVLALLIACAAWRSAAAQTTSPVPASFLKPTVIPTGNWPAAIYSADVNGDGYPDLIYIDQGATSAASTTHVLLNDGKANFTQSATLHTAGISVAIGDLTGSGHVDIGWFAPLSVDPHSNFLYIASGKGDGSFTAAQSYTGVTSQQPLTNLIAGRMHDTGPLDVIAQDSGSNQVDLVQVNATTHTLQSFSSGSLPDGIGPAFVTDLTGNGHGDLVVTGLTGAAVQIFLGNGSAAVSPIPSSPSRFVGPYGLQSLLVQPVDNDAYPDLVLEGANGRLDIFHGNGDGTFQSAAEGGTGALAGYNGHGGHLIAENTVAGGTRRNFYTSTPAGISVLLGQGNLSYTLQGIYNAGPGRSAYVIADFNHDGNPDLALDSPEGIAVLFGNPDGSFQTSPAYSTGSPATSLVLGPFSGRILPDAAVAISAQDAQIMRNDGHGIFTADFQGNSYPGGIQSVIASIQAGDLNGDGILDLILTTDGPHASLPPAVRNTASGIRVQFGSGYGIFSSGTSLSAETQFTTPDPASCTPPFDHYPNLFFGTAVVGDYNGDGLADIASRDSTAYRILRGNAYPAGNPTLFYSTVDGPQTGNVVDCGLHAHDLVVSGDLNNDGRPDLLYQGQGQNTGALQLFLTHPSAAPTLIGDLSVDGSLTSPGQLTAPALSPFNGPAVPTSSGGLGFPAFPGSAVVADLDRDGNNDLIVIYANLSANLAAPSSSAPNAIYLWFGSGGGKFLTSAKHPVNPVRLTPSRNFYQVAVADLNADGIPDLILSDGSILSIQYGNGDGTFGSEQHLLAGQGINSLSAADVNGDGKLDLVLANGGTLLANPVANRDTLTPNPDVATGGITVLLNQGTSTPTSMATGTLTASPEPSAFETGYTITAALTTTSAPPAGVTATFAVDGTTQATPVALQTASATSSQAVLSIPAASRSTSCPALTNPTLSPGTHALSVSFTGINYPNLTGSHTILLGPTTTVLTATTPLTTPYGTPINGTFVVTPVDNACPTTGTYTVYDNGLPATGCVNLPLTSQCPYGDPQLLDAGNHALSVSYNGGPSNNDPINASSSSTGVSFVITPDATSARVVSSLNPAPFGSTVTFTATLSGSVVTPTGTVQFFDGGTLLGSATLNVQGIATFTTSTLTLGVHPITVVYAGSQDFLASTSTVLNQQIVPAALPATSAIIASSLNPATVGAAVTFTATLTSGAGVPSGSVQFVDNGTVLGTATLSASGVATFTTSTLTLGLHPINAYYAGSASFAATDSGPVLQSIVAATTPPPSGFTLTVTPNPVTLGVGRTALLSVTVTPTGSFALPVQLGCTGLPSEATCVFVRGTLPTTGGTTTLQLTAGSPHPCNVGGQPYYPPSLAALFLISLTGAGLTRSRRTLRNLLLLVASIVTLPLLTACGGPCTDLGTYPGSYSFTVSATAQDLTVAATQTTRTVPIQMIVNLK